MEATQIFTNATSGSSSEFQLPDGSIFFSLTISGTALNPINAFLQKSTTSNNLYLKIKGLTGSGVVINLESKTNNSNDPDFNETGQSFNRNYGGFFYLQSKS